MPRQSVYHNWGHFTLNQRAKVSKGFLGDGEVFCINPLYGYLFLHIRNFVYILTGGCAEIRNGGGTLQRNDNTALSLQSLLSPQRSSAVTLGNICPGGKMCGTALGSI